MKVKNYPYGIAPRRGASARFMGQLQGFSIAAGALLALSACGNEAHVADDSGNLEQVATQTMPSTNNGGDVRVRFAAKSGVNDVGCGVDLGGLGSENTTIRLRDFRFYVHDIRLIAEDGSEAPITLEQDGVWQQGGAALLDFENKGSGCDGGTVEVRDEVKGTVTPGTYTGLAFKVGLPFEVNHQNPATAPSPLNLSAMHWNWQGGYKFVRIDMTNAAGLPLNFHLGSTGCDGDNSGNVTDCVNPNRPEVRFETFDLAQNTVVFDLEKLFEDVDLTRNTADTPPGCMSRPTDPDCEKVFRNVGLPWQTTPATAQRFMRAIP